MVLVVGFNFFKELPHTLNPYFFVDRNDKEKYAANSMLDETSNSKRFRNWFCKLLEI